MSEPLIGIQELAEWLGVKVSTVYDWVHTKRISYYKIGRLVKFRRTEVERWIEQQRVCCRA